MNNPEKENADEVLEKCENCGASVLEAYIEDGQCHQCRK